MTSSLVLRFVTVRSCVHRRYPDALPLFAGIVMLTHRELIAHVLITEPDWQWHEPSHKR